MGFCNLTAEAESARDAISAICDDAGIDLKDCYQCGKCAAGCPVAETADISCRQVIRNLQLGMLDAVLNARMPWLCLGCATCVTRCPHDVNMPALNEAICRYAMAHDRVTIKEGEKFDEIFLDTVQAKGVNDEVAFAMKYNLSTGHLFQDVGNSPRMLSRGLLSGDGYAPGDAAQVKAMMEAIRSGKKPEAAAAQASEPAVAEAAPAPATATAQGTAPATPAASAPTQEGGE